MPTTFKATYQSEIGRLEITGTAEHVTAVNFVEPEANGLPAKDAELPPIMAACLAQLDEYFKGERREFSLALQPEGTGFQKAVWQQLAAIPYGQTASYGDVARALGNPQAVRAVGAANGQNPISIIIPCHRVIGSNGKLTGYGGGLWRKEWLLEHEGCFRPQQMKLL